MMRISSVSLLILAFVFVVVSSHPVYGQTPSAIITGQGFVECLAGEDYAAAYEYLAEEYKARVSQDDVIKGWKNLISRKGEFLGFGKCVYKGAKGSDKVKLTLIFENRNEAIALVFDMKEKITGIRF